jgi:hypothetical protein
MNYLAHSLAFLGASSSAFNTDGLLFWRVAGTSLPDWLRVVDKHARLRPEVLAAVVTDDVRWLALREGAQRHHDDDHTFHLDEAFDAHAADLAKRIRLVASDVRASTLAHVLTEMLVDAELMRADPTLLARYHDGLDALDLDVIAEFSRHATRRPLLELPTLIERFLRSRFLGRYLDDDGLFDCLQGVCRRAGLQAPPRDALLPLLSTARGEVAPLVQRFFGVQATA